METQENKNTSPETSPKFNKGFLTERSSRALGGLLIVVVGSLLFLRKANVELPEFLFTWQWIPIIIGLYIGARHRFQDWVWLIPVSIGVIFMVDEFVVNISIGEFVWPIILISIGLFMIFRPKRNAKNTWQRWEAKRNIDYANNYSTSSDVDILDAVTIFGGTKKMIISKNFQGGEAVTIFGGVELNLTQADIQGRVVLELVQAFGGAKLVVPSNWIIQADEMVCIFGGLDDKRNLMSLTPDPTKILVLKGTCIFGGIDIKSY